MDRISSVPKSVLRYVLDKRLWSGNLSHPNFVFTNKEADGRDRVKQFITVPTVWNTNDYYYIVQWYRMQNDGLSICESRWLYWVRFKFLYLFLFIKNKCSLVRIWTPEPMFWVYEADDITMCHRASVKCYKLLSREEIAFQGLA